MRVSDPGEGTTIDGLVTRTQHPKASAVQDVNSNSRTWTSYACYPYCNRALLFISLSTYGLLPVVVPGGLLDE
jgi:hypothetical protein